ncbi:hypothetical protein Lal_00029847 [Lupinus albus]|nr:hypothetical protein Lal_00029847 [Lupinus albus]
MNTLRSCEDTRMELWFALNLVDWDRESFYPKRSGGQVMALSPPFFCVSPSSRATNPVNQNEEFEIGATVTSLQLHKPFLRRKEKDRIQYHEAEKRSLDIIYASCVELRSGLGLFLFSSHCQTTTLASLKGLIFHVVPFSCHVIISDEFHNTSLVVSMALGG